MSQDIFEAITHEIEYLEKALLMEIVQTHSKRLKYIANMLTTVKALCRGGHRHWGIVRNEVEVNITHAKDEKRLFDELSDLETTEDRLLKIAKEISQIIYSDKEFHDKLKAKNKLLYEGLKRFIMRIVNLMVYLKNEQQGLVVKTEELERQFVYKFGRDPSAMIGHYFNHIH